MVCETEMCRDKWQLPIEKVLKSLVLLGIIR